MDYISTRGSAPTLDFRAATLAGLASDGGLYVPAAWPQMSAQDIRALAGLDYAETAVRVMMPFVAGVLDEAELRELCRAAYGRFSHDAVTPLGQQDSSALRSLASANALIERGVDVPETKAGTPVPVYLLDNGGVA